MVLQEISNNIFQKEVIGLPIMGKHGRIYLVILA